MAERAKSRVLDVVAHGFGPPCLAVAFLLYFVVGWVPGSSPSREVLCGALLLAGLGASLVTVRGASQRLRMAGAIAMGVGFVVIVGLGLW
jgi:hypothetical protein